MKITKKPVIKRYPLESDEEGEAWVEFRQARRGEDERRQGLLDDMSYLYDENGNFSGFRPNNSRGEIEAFDIYQTLTGCNIVYDEDDEPVFPFKESNGFPRLDLTETEFKRRWDSLPSELAAEIVKLCHQHNPNWAWFNEGTNEDDEEKA